VHRFFSFSRDKSASDIKLREGLREGERIPSGNRIAIAPHCVTATEDNGRNAPTDGH
jgi:hypothetical protein